jgi:cytochrome P450
MAAIEPRARDFCAHSLDRLVGSGRFDFVRDLGAQMPMRVIGKLLGIPENDQELVRDYVDAGISTEPGQPIDAATATLDGQVFADYIDWRAEHPSDDRKVLELPISQHNKRAHTCRYVRANSL